MNKNTSSDLIVVPLYRAAHGRTGDTGDRSKPATLRLVDERGRWRLSGF